MATFDMALEKGLPTNLDAERYVLGSILLDDTLFVQVPRYSSPTTSAWRSIAVSSGAWPP